MVFFLVQGSGSAQDSSLLAPPTTARSNAILSVPGEELVPAALGVRTDPKGHSWNIERNGSLGRVGSAMVNSGLVLTINQQKFDTFQPRMTRDGKEFVIHGTSLPGLGGIQVSRRVRFVDQNGSLRYLELFFNGSANPVTLDIELATSFSGNFKSALTNRATIDPVMLKDGESGILVTPETSQANRGFLFVLSGETAPEKPTISSQNRYGLTFQYQLTLQPGETRGLTHVVTQVVVPGEMDRQSLARLFAPFSLASVAETIPDGFQDKMANRSATDTAMGLDLKSYTLAALGLEPLDADVLAMGDETRLFGTATLSDVEMVTDYGPVKVPANQIAGVSGKNRGARDRIRVYLNDGQVFGGNVAPEAEISFAPKGNGNIRVTYDKLDRLVRLAVEKTLLPEGIFVQTWSGDRLLLVGSGKPLLTGVTPWGSLPFALEELRWLAPNQEGLPGYRLRLKNGTDSFLLLKEGEIPFEKGLLVDKTLNVNQIHSIVPARGSGDYSAASARVFLKGNQSVSGILTSDELTFVSNGQVLTVLASRIRSCRQIDSKGDLGSPLFQIDLTDGSRIEGRFHGFELGLPFRVRDQPWRIPFEDMVSIETPGPVLDEESRSLVAALIVKLGDESWAAREKATQELTLVGLLALPMLKSELVLNPDPEIRRRLEKIVAGFRQ